MICGRPPPVGRIRLRIMGLVPKPICRLRPKGDADISDNYKRSMTAGNIPSYSIHPSNYRFKLLGRNLCNSEILALWILDSVYLSHLYGFTSLALQEAKKLYIMAIR